MPIRTQLNRVYYQYFQIATQQDLLDEEYNFLWSTREIFKLLNPASIGGSLMGLPIIGSDLLANLGYHSDPELSNNEIFKLYALGAATLAFVYVLCHEKRGNFDLSMAHIPLICLPIFSTLSGFLSAHLAQLIDLERCTPGYGANAGFAGGLGCLLLTYLVTVLYLLFKSRECDVRVNILFPLTHSFAQILHDAPGNPVTLMEKCLFIIYTSLSSAALRSAILDATHQPDTHQQEALAYVGGAIVGGLVDNRGKLLDMGKMIINKFNAIRPRRAVEMRPLAENELTNSLTINVR